MAAAEVFQSEEFLQFEKLCQSKKLSFVVCVTKFSSCIKPKKGPQYVMSDFFVHDIPSAWERSDIRTTPAGSWLNPKPPPPLSMPLSRLIKNPTGIKKSFLELWNHLHGVMTETYFCPKLYLSRIPKAEVVKWMKTAMSSTDQFPKGDFLSCCDLVHFVEFAKWIQSSNPEESVNNASNVRINFLALMIAHAFSLYNIDPEKHIRSIVGDAKAEEKVNANDDNCDDLEIIVPENSESSTSSSVKNTGEKEKVNHKNAAEKSGKVDSELCGESSSLTLANKNDDKNKKDEGSPKSGILRIRNISEINNELGQDDDIEIISVEKTKFGIKSNDLQIDRTTFLPSSSSKGKFDTNSKASVQSSAIAVSLGDCQLSITPTKDITISKLKSSPSKTPRPSSTITPVDKAKALRDVSLTLASSIPSDSNLLSASMLLNELSQKATSQTTITKVTTGDSLGKDDSICILSDGEEESLKKNSSQNDDTVSIESIDSMETESNIEDVTSAENDGRSHVTSVEITPLSLGYDEHSSKENEKSSGQIDSQTQKSKPVEINSEKEITPKNSMAALINDEKTESSSGREVMHHRDIVSVSLGKLIQICVKLLKQDEYRVFSRKVSKYLNSLPEESPKFVELTSFIDQQCEKLKKDSENVFVYIQSIFEMIKNNKKETVDNQQTKEENSPSKTGKAKESKASKISEVKDIPESISEGPTKYANAGKENIEDPVVSSVSSKTSVTTNEEPNVSAKDGSKSTENEAKKTEEKADFLSTIELVPVSQDSPITTDDNNEDEARNNTVEESVMDVDEGQDKSNPELEQKTLKEVLTDFLGKCRNTMSAKTFKPRFKQILDLMNSLDPVNLNSPSLKQFIFNLSGKIGSDSDETLSLVEAVTKEIEKYQKCNSKRPLDDVNNEKPEEPAAKKLCTNSINTNKSAEEVVKESTDESTNNSKVNSTTDTNTSKKRIMLTTIVSKPISNKDSDSDNTTVVSKTIPNENSDCGNSKKDNDTTSSAMVASIDNPTIEAEKEKESHPIIEMEGSDKFPVQKKSKEGGEKKKVSTKHMKKLEDALKKCAKQIRKLEEAEVDWDNEDDESNYVLCAKYKRRYMQLHRKIAEYKQMSSSLDRKCDKKFFCSESRYPEINKKIQKFVNKTKQFPDFQDIRNLVLEANKDLHLSKMQIDDEAEQIFRSVGKRLKGRREIDESEILNSYIPEDNPADPASKDEDLNKILVEQGKEGKKRIEKYFDDFYKEHVINKGADTETTEQIKIDDYFPANNNENSDKNEDDSNIDKQPNRDETVEESTDKSDAPNKENLSGNSNEEGNTTKEN